MASSLCLTHMDAASCTAWEAPGAQAPGRAQHPLRALCRADSEVRPPTPSLTDEETEAQSWHGSSHSWVADPSALESPLTLFSSFSPPEELTTQQHLAIAAVPWPDSDSDLHS